MFKYLKKAGDEVEIVTIDDIKDPPVACEGFPITNIRGFRFPFYKDICLAFDRKWAIMKTFRKFKPELIHCSAPGFIVFMTLFVARRLRVPLVMSYHTHLPLYTRQYIKFVPGWLSEMFAWLVVKTVLTKADLVLVTSPQVNPFSSFPMKIKKVSIFFLSL
jgi:sulfoquinovosyltransferase